MVNNNVISMTTEALGKKQNRQQIKLLKWKIEFLFIIQKERNCRTCIIDRLIMTRTALVPLYFLTDSYYQ